MLTMFDAEIKPPRAKPQLVEQQRMMERAAALTVRIQKLRALTATLTTERDELVARCDALAKG